MESFPLSGLNLGKKERHSVFLGHRLSLPASGGVGKENVAPGGDGAMKRSFLGQYWMVFVGSGLAMVLVTVGLAVGVMALKAESAKNKSVSTELSSEVPPMQVRPPVAPARLLNGSDRIPMAPPAAVLDTFVARPIREVVKKEPVPEIPNEKENPEIGQPEPKGFMVLLDHLNHKSPQVRLRAIVGLGKMGAAAKDAVPAIAKALSDPDKEMRNAAGKALARIGPTAVPVFIQELKNPASRNDILSARNLALIGPDAADAVPALTECLKQKDNDLLATAAHALGEIGPPSWKAATSLTLLLGDGNPEVQKQARAALAKIGPGAIPALRGALKSPQSPIRRRAADLLALQGSKAKDATGDLIALLKDKQPAVRKAAALSLAAIGPDASQASEALVDCVQDKDASVRAAVALALGHIRARGQAISTLVNLFRDPVQDVRLQAIGAIVKFGPSAINVLINTVPHEDLNMRTSAIFALGEIGPAAKDAVPLLIEQLQDKLPLIRNQSALALGKIGPRAAEKAIEPLKESVLKEREIPVRINMRLALVQLQPGDQHAAQELTRDLVSFVTFSNQELFKVMVVQTQSLLQRPRTPAEIMKQIKIQGVLNFYVFRNSFRFGDGLDEWSHKLLQSLGIDAIPAMVDTLNKENMVGGLEGYLWRGMAVLDAPDAGRNSTFFH
jgi:HEAT repeat protein